MGKTWKSYMNELPKKSTNRNEIRERVLKVLSDPKTSSEVGDVVWGHKKNSSLIRHSNAKRAQRIIGGLIRNGVVQKIPRREGPSKKFQYYQAQSI